MNNSFIKILEEIFDLKGIEVLLDKNILVSMVKDLAGGSLKKETFILSQLDTMMLMDIFKSTKTQKSLELSVCQISYQIIDQFGISEDMSKLIMYSLYCAICNSKSWKPNIILTKDKKSNENDTKNHSEKPKTITGKKSVYSSLLKKKLIAVMSVICIMFGILIYFNGIDGLIRNHKKYESGNYVVIHDNMRIRVSPSINSDVVSVVDSGTFLKIKNVYKSLKQSDDVWGETFDGWICIRSKNKDLLTVLSDKDILKIYHGYEPGSYIVSHNNMRIRKAPSVDGDVVSIAKSGTQLEIYDIYVSSEYPNDVWGKFSKGWICISSGSEKCLTFQE